MVGTYTGKPAIAFKVRADLSHALDVAWGRIGESLAVVGVLIDAAPK